MKCPCCNKYDVSDKKLKLTKALASITGVCVVCFELVNSSAFDNLEDYVKVAGKIKFGTFEDTPFHYTNEEVIKAVKKYTSKCRPNSYGDEDDGYNEHMSEMAYIIERAEAGENDMKTICSDLCFNPARYL
jgi:hypothetical protein